MTLVATVVALASSALWFAPALAPRRSQRVATNPVAPWVQVPRGQVYMGVAEYQSILLACERDVPDAVEELTTLHGSRTLSMRAFYCGELGGQLHEMPRRVVLVDDFWIQAFEVTVADYRSCVKQGACDAAPLLAPGDLNRDPRLPIVYLTPDAAATYCRHVGGQLPTEAQWLRAALGDAKTPYPWGSEAGRWRINHGGPVSRTAGVLYSASKNGTPEWFAPDEQDGYRTAAPGGAMFSRGPFGTFDQFGNVAELVADLYSSDDFAGYSVATGSNGETLYLPAVNPSRPAGPGDRHVVLGGSWLTPLWLSQGALRMPFGARAADLEVGFRCARNQP